MRKKETKGYKMVIVAISRERWGLDRTERWCGDEDSHMLLYYLRVFFFFFCNNKNLCRLHAVMSDSL